MLTITNTRIHTRNTQAWLALHEAFDRGFYAGPFGWVSGAGAEFAVAIRSALVQHNTSSSGGVLSSSTQSASQTPSLTQQQQKEQQRHDTSSTTGQLSMSQQQQQEGQEGSENGAGPSHTVHLYAGVGVVSASEPSSEWQVRHW